MKIVILSRFDHLYSTRRLKRAAEVRGHQVLVVDPLLCYMNINSQEPSISFNSRRIQGVHAVIPRIGASITFYGNAVLRQFEMMGSLCLSRSESIARSRDKLKAHQLLSQSGIDVPVTGFAHSTEMSGDLIDLVGGAPLVIKLLEGDQGRGVVLAETRKAAESVIDGFRNLNAYFLVQEFIEEAGGSDIRCFVIGHQVVAAMKRQAKPGDFRSNLHRGGVPESVTLTNQEKALAIRAAQLMGLGMAGVDILRSRRGPLVLEVNSSPGLEGIEKITGQPIAEQIIEHVEGLLEDQTRKPLKEREHEC